MTQPVNLTVKRVRASPAQRPLAEPAPGVVPGVLDAVLGRGERWERGEMRGRMGGVPEVAFAARFLSREDRLAWLGIAGFVLLLRELLQPEGGEEASRGEPAPCDCEDGEEEEDDHEPCDDAKACARRTWADETINLLFETDPDPGALTRPELALLFYLRQARNLTRQPFDDIADALSDKQPAEGENVEMIDKPTLFVRAIVDLAVQLRVLPDDEDLREAAGRLGRGILMIRPLIADSNQFDTEKAREGRELIREGIPLLSGLETSAARSILLYTLLHTQALDRQANRSRSSRDSSLPVRLMRRRWRTFFDALRLRTDRLEVAEDHTRYPFA